MSTTPLTASCLCGDVRWELDAPPLRDSGEPEAAATATAPATPPTPPTPPTPLDLLRMTHCHCSRCRKAHGAPYATYLVARAERFRMTHGLEQTVRYQSAPGGVRPFCGRCGSVVPEGTPWNGYVGMPAGPFDDDPGLRPTAHIFVASKAPWFEIHDDLPRFDAYPPGLDDPTIPDRPPIDPPGAPRGSCLCGQVTYVVEGAPIRCRTCHCSRCRKAGSAANVAYLATKLGGVRFTRGEELAVTYKVPEAKFFEHRFCRVCGSSLPRSDHGRGIDLVPMGSLDDDPGIRPQAHIFVASKAPWDVIGDGLPEHAEYPLTG